VVNNVLTLNDLAERVESESSFSVSDVKGLVEAFQKYIAVELSLGHSVRIDGLGTFSSALSGKVERSKEGRLRLRRPRVRTVNFRPAVALMRRFRETTFRAESGAPLAYANPQRDELLEQLRNLGTQQTCFLASDVMHATGMSRDRTYARLHQFVDEGTLLNVGTRRRAVYRLP
jgi:putative DNA-binding protein